MELHNINSQTSAAFNQQETLQKNQMGQQQFLQLLVAQMRHQDPVNPLNGAEFASQLAQFNSVEQLINVNQGISQLSESQEIMSMGLTNSLAASLTGKNVKAMTDAVYLPPGESTGIQYKLNNSASKVEIVIKNSSGQEVRRETLQNVSAAEHLWEWDGKNNHGDRMPDGQYQISIEAANDDGSNVDVLTYVEGLATKVRYSGEGVKLMVNGVEVPIGNIEEVGLSF